MNRFKRKHPPRPIKPETHGVIKNIGPLAAAKLETLNARLESAMLGFEAARSKQLAVEVEVREFCDKHGLSLPALRGAQHFVTEQGEVITRGELERRNGAQPAQLLRSVEEKK